uniref:C2H2-type domain-containing protein n=1 Tax=Romanomermis culicivorax TaxID=13658 RepID=A0A915L689_ROMCU
MSAKKIVHKNTSKKLNITRAIEVDLNALIDEKKNQPSPRPSGTLKTAKNSAAFNQETSKKPAAIISIAKSTPAVEKLAPIFLKSAPTISASANAKFKTSPKKVCRNPKIGVIEKLKINSQATPKNRPIRKPKREILDEDEQRSTSLVLDPVDETYPKSMTGEQALNHFKSFQLEIRILFEDKLDEWRSLDSRIHFRILKKTFQKLTKSKESRVQCLNTSCSSSYTTAYGMQYHLRVCGIPVENRLKQCSHCEKKFPSDELTSHIRIEHNIQTSTPVRKSASKCMSLIGKIDQVENSITDDKKNKRKDDSEDENYTGENEDDEDVIENRANSSSVFKSPSKKKRCKKVRAVPESLRKIWHQKLEKAFEGFIRTNFIASNEAWIPEIKFQNFRLRRDLTFFEKFEQESMEFCFEKLSKPQKLKLFESVDIDEKKSMGYCGGPTICAKWCPQISQLSDDDKQYLAVCNHIDHSMQNYSGPMENSFQIWSYDSRNRENEKRLKCEYLIRHEYGLSLHLKWCPSGANIPESEGQQSIMGLL